MTAALPSVCYMCHPHQAASPCSIPVCARPTLFTVPHFVNTCTRIPCCWQARSGGGSRPPHTLHRPTLCSHLHPAYPVVGRHALVVPRVDTLLGTAAWAFRGRLAVLSCCAACTAQLEGECSACNIGMTGGGKGRRGTGGGGGGQGDKVGGMGFTARGGAGGQGEGNRGGREETAQGWGGAEG